MSVPTAQTRVRRSRVRNIDTDRLLARQAFLVAMALDGFADAVNRRPFVDRARELHAVENELDRRGVEFVRRSLPCSVAGCVHS